jgi:thiol-disulfide isomerase/thioredoxin
MIVGLAFKEGAMAQTENPSSKPINEIQKMPLFELPGVDNEAERTYLGLAERGSFKAGDIQCQALIIEIFDFYCSYCQAMAPIMNDLYKTIENDPSLKGKIKIIGIAIGDQPYEVNQFRKKFQVVFPLFPDPFMRVAKKLSVNTTPIFIVARTQEKGVLEKVHVHPGPFTDGSLFLSEVIKRSGIKQEEVPK